MKQFLFFCLAVFTFQNMLCQDTQSDLVKVGDELMISKMSGQHYQHIDIPRKNFIIKRGGIANMSSIENTTVIVTKVSNNGNPTITFKKSDGRKFFKAYRTLTANLKDALESGELKIKTESLRDSSAK